MTQHFFASKKAIIISLLLIIFTTVEGGNVLAVFPHFGLSHFKVIQPILNELAVRGHQVTVISYVKNPMATEPNYEQLLISDAQEDQANTTINVVPLTEHTPSRSLFVLLKEYHDLHVEGQQTCELLYASGHVQTVLQRHRQRPYDVLITEYFNSDCQLAIAQQLQLPIIGLSTCALMPYYYDRIDLPDTPAYVQSEFIGFLQPLNWHERLLNYAQAKLLKLLYRHHSNRVDNALIKRYLDIDVDVNEVAQTQTAFVFVNQHYTLMGSRPHTQQLVEVGGVHIAKDSKELPANIAKFLSQSPTGVILISWGSMVRASSIDEQKLAAIVKALQQQPLRVIWKWEAEQMPKVDANKFLFVKWAPQLALLCHPQVQLFWAHGGLLGITEAIHCGIPLLVTPIYGDQFLNAFAVENRGIGLKLDYLHIDVQSLTESLEQLTKPSFAQRAQQLSQIFQNRERAPLDSAVWCVEHVIQHGLLAAQLLQSPGIKLTPFVYHSLDCLALLLAASITVLLLLLLCSCHLLGGTNFKTPKKKTKHT